MLTSRHLGLWGLLAFEAILVAYSFGNGFPAYGWMALFGGAVLVAVLAFEKRSPAILPWALVALSGMTFVRGLWQTVLRGAPPAVYTTYLVPLGFALAAYATWRPSARVLAWGLASVGVARAFFAVWYFQFGLTTLVIANLIAAAGVLLWAYSASSDGQDADPDGAPLEGST